MDNLNNPETVEPNKGGRPPGKENAITLLDRELKQTIKTLTTMRTTVESQINTCRKAIDDPNMPIQTRLEIINQIANIMAVMSKNVETLSKYTLGQAKQRERQEADDSTSSHAKGDLAFLLRGSK